MKLTQKEQTLYDFFIQFGEAVGSVEYPISLLAIWTSGDDETHMSYANKQAVIDAYAKIGTLDKPLYLAIKKKLKDGNRNGQGIQKDAGFKIKEGTRRVKWKDQRFKALFG